MCFVTSFATCFKTHCKNTKRIDIVQYKFKESLDIVVFLISINTKCNHISRKIVDIFIFVT